MLLYYETAKSCNFCESLHKSLLRDRIVSHVRDNQSRKRMFDANFHQGIAIYHSCEATSAQLKVMGDLDQSEKMNKFENQSRKQKFRKQVKINCNLCGKTYNKLEK